MNRAPPKPAAAATRRPQPKPKPKPNSKPSNRSPLKDLNAGVAFKSRSSTCSSSSSSTEPTAGCSRFRFSNSLSSSNSCENPSNRRARHRSDCNSRNPRNATTTKPRLKSCKPLDQGRKISYGSTDSAAELVPKIIRLRLCQMMSRKKVISAGRDELLFRSGLVEGAVRESGKDFEFTPLGCKTGALEFGFGKVLGGSNCDKNDNGSGNTPPAEATVSPEIQCESKVMSVSTPVCFGAGHVLSGVSYKRKCRPRGVLVVGGNCEGIDGLSTFNEGLDGIGDVDGSRKVVPLLPAEASVHWLLSPCDENDVDRNEDSELLTSVPRRSSLSGSSGYGTSSNVSKDKNAKMFSNPLVSPSKSLLFQSLLESPSDKMASTSSHSSPYTTPNDEGVISWFDEKIYSNMAGENSQGSKDTLGSENAIQTPESYSSLERHMSQPWLFADDGKHIDKPNLDCVVDGQHRTSVSSEGQIFVSEIESGFEFDCHLKPASSIEFSQLQHKWDKSSWTSDAIVENEQRPQFRISWRDELSSHHIEIDNSDCCRILTDKADENVQYSPDPVISEPKLPEINKASFIEKIDFKNAGSMNRNENSIFKKDIQCAVSISLDGGSLAASEDSGWDMCYKDNLFQVE